MIKIKDWHDRKVLISFTSPTGRQQFTCYVKGNAQTTEIPVLVLPSGWFLCKMGNTLAIASSEECCETSWRKAPGNSFFPIEFSQTQAPHQSSTMSWWWTQLCQPLSVGQTLMHGRPIASSDGRVIYALSRNGNDAAIWGGKMKKSSKILNSFTALRDLLGHWGWQKPSKGFPRRWMLSLSSSPLQALLFQSPEVHRAA